MKKYILLALALITLNSQAEDTIYKCTSSSGEVSYINISSIVSKNKGCIKTDLAVVSKPKTVTFNKKLSSSQASGENVLGSMVVYNSEQKDRDSKRQNVLQKELDDEEAQLLKVSHSLKTLKDNKNPDKKQMEEFVNLQNQHTRNIEALRKELGKKELPISLPLSSIPLKFENTAKYDNKIIVGK